MIYSDGYAEGEPRVEFRTDVDDGGGQGAGTGTGRLFPLEELYFCDACSLVCSRYGLTEEIDSYYCPHCLENMPSSEAMLYLNRCSKCFECPICFNTLTITAAHDGKCFFSCQFCRWSSGEIQLEAEKPDMLVAAAFQKERDSPHRTEMNKLVETFRKASQEITRERELQARMRRRSITLFLPATSGEGSKRGSKSGGGAHPWVVEDLENMLKDKKTKLKTMSIRTTTKKGVRIESISLKDLIAPSDEKARSIAEQLKSLDETPTDTIASLDQRTRCINEEAHTLSGLIPSRKPLLTKRSRRCRQCTRYVVKPQINPCSTPPFQKQNIAWLYVPRVLLVHPNPNEIGVGRVMSVSFAMYNPVESNTTARFAADAYNRNISEGEEEEDRDNNSSSSNPFGYTMDVLTEPFETVIGPHNELQDVHEGLIEEDSAAVPTDDNPEIITERKGNKIMVCLRVKPHDDSAGKEATFGIPVELSFKDRTMKEHNTHIHLVFTLGIISGASE
ncbi:unnamed protein product [Vitrella brassicaformis CCMP3155]|uniref:Dynactin subunit 4 n=1 Tax=Vitrella brassicaformis (strain CCMP3155) TaxID=1169540 RepID=A0A0G4GTD9_VITBC|nr:unnamed protein product [Vitrella brassicaformis CCMP3155]|mmetsp:Transcript_48902/g.122481  ORF Transcript_48902/g.122481 Transcript_48902/m.122481 type:complete len:504 (-) Transcript_48902:504-2015(-)|eukprot:CEM33987.1 unnamed protein product [Vitrella brassicaformis CCMP3155]